jgi:hypothetical protein
MKQKDLRVCYKRLDKSRQEHRVQARAQRERERGKRCLCEVFCSLFLPFSKACLLSPDLLQTQLECGHVKLRNRTDQNGGVRRRAVCGEEETRETDGPFLTLDCKLVALESKKPRAEKTAVQPKCRPRYHSRHGVKRRQTRQDKTRQDKTRQDKTRQGRVN